MGVQPWQTYACDRLHAIAPSVSPDGDFAVSRQSVSDICAELYVLYFVKRASSET